MKSMIVTVTCLLFAMVLIFICTLAQVDTDIHTVETTMLRSFFVWRKGFPVFPGGATIALILLANIGISFSNRRIWKKKSLVLVHFGFVLLLLSEALRMVYANESLMILNIGETVFYSENPEQTELALIDHSSLDSDNVKSVTLTQEVFPFTLSNDNLSVTINQDSYEVLNEGSWPLIPGSRKFNSCEICIRPKRIYTPYGVKLQEFKYQFHPGSDIPKSFNSKVTITDDDSNVLRDVEITMNSPLQFKGKTYYQKNYADNGKTSVLHVVENRWKNLPYISLLIIATGLMTNLFRVLRKR